MHRVDVTTFSRSGSRGGLVTWANSCLKYSGTSLGRRERGASGASLPMEPSGSPPPANAMGASSRSTDSRVNPAALRAGSRGMRGSVASAGALAPAPAPLVAAAPPPTAAATTSPHVHAAAAPAGTAPTTSPSVLVCSANQSAYGWAAAAAALSSASRTTRPFSRSTKNSVPGVSRPLASTLAGSTSTTPTSDAMMTRPSLVRT